MKLKLSALEDGLTTAEIFERLVVQNPEVSAIHAFAYRHPPLLQDRLEFDPKEKAVLGKALSLRKKTGMPFWEALLLSCFDESLDFSRLLGEARFHQSHRSSICRISRQEALGGRLVEFSNNPPDGCNLSISSGIEVCGGALKHLPFLDFHCPESVRNDRLVSDVCIEIYRSPVIVMSSGESYHSIGLELLGEAELRGLLTRSLLYSPIVDARYVTHQLLEGACALRLSSSVNKPRLPRLRFVVDSHRED
ncbi:primase 1D-like protein [Luteolibacter soli]|uniref:Uncharacterized protein n=1 Tax=Luteolibacter soli TaxID=3135280 RepID=A0ABU9AXC1_9BACT